MTDPARRSSPDTAYADRLFVWSAVLTTAIKLALAAWFPLTGDEAYFIQWGQQLAGSYYDHGPVTGWWIWAMRQVGEDVFVIRLPAVLSSLLVAWVLRWILRPLDARAAAYGATLFLWSPVALLCVLMTTDIPLLVLSALSVAFACRAQRTDRIPDYVLSGLFLGLAFLAKYFAVLLGIAYAIWWLGFSPRRRWAGLAWLLVGVAPLVAQHLYWNYHHAWVNVVFNLFTRQEHEGITWHGPLLFALMLSYMLGPLWLLRARSSGLFGCLRTRLFGGGPLTELGLAAAVFLIPHTILLFVSFSHPVGLHWLLSFFPFVFVIVGSCAPLERLRKLLRPMIIFGLFHVGVVATVILLPVEWAKASRSHRSIVMGRHPDEFVAALRPLLDGHHVASTSYSKAALLAYYLDQPVPVMGLGSYHGRQDDLRTDWRALAGEDFLVLAGRDNQLDEVRQWFREADVREIPLRGAVLKVVLGRGFDYERYRRDVLQRVADNYYIMPPWLERYSSGCFFRERYDLPSRQP